jgi:hypothetical protein
MAAAMTRFHWIMPVSVNIANRLVVPDTLLTTFWAACLVYAVFNGLMYGTRTALFMDITTPAVAATQFTAYMALLNFVIQYSARWQGLALERWGYPATLTIDGAVGLISLSLLPLMASKGLRPQASGRRAVSGLRPAAEQP